jgi:hypothetical protein
MWILWLYYVKSIQQYELYLYNMYCIIMTYSTSYVIWLTYESMECIKDVCI